MRLFALLLRFIPYHSQSNRKDNPCGKCVKFGPTNWTVRGSRDYSWTTPRLLPNGTRVLPELPFRKPGLLPPKFGTPLSENRISTRIVNFFRPLPCNWPCGCQLPFRAGQTRNFQQTMKRGLPRKSIQCPRPAHAFDSEPKAEEHQRSRGKP